MAANALAIALMFLKSHVALCRLKLYLHATNLHATKGPADIDSHCPRQSHHRCERQRAAGAMKTAPWVAACLFALCLLAGSAQAIGLRERAYTGLGFRAECGPPPAAPLRRVRSAPRRPVLRPGGRWERLCRHRTRTKAAFTLPYSLLQPPASTWATSAIATRRPRPAAGSSGSGTVRVPAAAAAVCHDASQAHRMPAWPGIAGPLGARLRLSYTPGAAPRWAFITLPPALPLDPMLCHRPFRWADWNDDITKASVVARCVYNLLNQAPASSLPPPGRLPPLRPDPLPSSPSPAPCQLCNSMPYMIACGGCRRKDAGGKVLSS